MKACQYVSFWPGLSRQPPDCLKAIQCLEELEELTRLIRPGRASRASQGRRSQRQVASGNEYRVEHGRRGPSLTEYFAEDRAPFRVDKHIYDAVATALDSYAKPVAVEEILPPARKTTRPDLPDHLVRVCLRFWLSRT